jgi:hypothetical protein
MIRLAETWRPLQVTPEHAATMLATAAEHLAQNPVVKEGYSYTDIRHKDMSPFRVTAVGDVSTHVVLVSRLPADGADGRQEVVK